MEEEEEEEDASAKVISGSTTIQFTDSFAVGYFLYLGGTRSAVVRKGAPTGIYWISEI